MVCFTEAPLDQVFALNFGRYKPMGFIFSKKYLFDLGARPVIYQPLKDYDSLPDNLKWRHVTFDLSGAIKVDFTWEREWRLETDELELLSENVKLFIPELYVDMFIERYNEEKLIEYEIIESMGYEDYYDLELFPYQVISDYVFKAGCFSSVLNK